MIAEHTLVGKPLFARNAGATVPKLIPTGAIHIIVVAEKVEARHVYESEKMAGLMLVPLIGLVNCGHCGSCHCSPCWYDRTPSHIGVQKVMHPWALRLACALQVGQVAQFGHAHQSPKACDIITLLGKC